LNGLLAAYFALNLESH